MTRKQEARKEFPGHAVPDSQKDPVRYERYWRAMALWAYRWAPVLLQEDQCVGPKQRTLPGSSTEKDT